MDFADDLLVDGQLGSRDGIGLSGGFWFRDEGRGDQDEWKQDIFHGMVTGMLYLVFSFNLEQVAIRFMPYMWGSQLSYIPLAISLLFILNKERKKEI